MLIRIRDCLSRRDNLRGHVWQSLANYANHGLAFLTGIFLARLLTPADFGAVATAAATATLVCLPLEWGAAQNLLTDRSRSASLYRETLSIGLIITLLKVVLCTLLTFYFYRTQSVAVALMFAGVCGPVVVSTVAAILRCAVEGTGNFRANFTSQIVTMLSAGLVGLTMAAMGFGAWSLVGMGIAAMIPPFFIYPQHVPHRFHWQLDRAALAARGKNGFWLWLIQVSGNAYRNVDRLILSHMVDPMAVGNYTRALNYTQTSSLLLSSLYSHPTISAFARADSTRAVKRILAINSAILTVGAILSFVLFYFFSDPLVPTVFGSQWTAAIPTFQAFAPINLCIAFFFLPQNFLHARRAYAFTAWTRCGALIFLVVALLAAGQGLNSTTTAYLLQAGYLVGGLACWVELLRVYRRRLYYA